MPLRLHSQDLLGFVGVFFYFSLQIPELLEEIPKKARFETSCLPVFLRVNHVDTLQGIKCYQKLVNHRANVIKSLGIKFPSAVESKRLLSSISKARQESLSNLKLSRDRGPVCFQHFDLALNDVFRLSQIACCPVALMRRDTEVLRLRKCSAKRKAGVTAM